MKTQPIDYSDLIDSRPWYDSDDDTWHIEHLWMYWKGKRHSYTTCDPDGNHEHCGAVDARHFMRDAAKDWDKYNVWAAEEGEDPLNNFMVTREDIVEEKWTVTLSPWVGMGKHGVKILFAVGPEGKVTPDQFPKHVKEWSNARKVRGVWVCPDFKTNAEIEEVGLKRNGLLWTATDNLERKTPRSKANIATQIREIAGRKST